MSGKAPSCDVVRIGAGPRRSSRKSCLAAGSAAAGRSVATAARRLDKLHIRSKIVKYARRTPAQVNGQAVGGVTAGVGWPGTVGRYG